MMMATMQRVVNLHNAIHTLEFPYTYETRRIPEEKKSKRKMLGEVAADIIKTMRDEEMETLWQEMKQWFMPELD